MEASFYLPRWSLPETVAAVMTTRIGGISVPPWRGLNLGLNSGDSAAHVMRNRERLAGSAALPAPPRFLRQVHGSACVDQMPIMGSLPAVSADAQITDSRQLPLAILAADCLPVLLCDARGDVVAAAHAGWRGVLGGVLPQIVRELRARLPAGRQLRAWIGPGIGPCCFEVGAEVREAFVERDARARSLFKTLDHDPEKARYKANLPALAALQLRDAGVQITQDGQCTMCLPERFFSYRRDGQTGRMAAMIWRK